MIDFKVGFITGHDRQLCEFKKSLQNLQISADPKTKHSNMYIVKPIDYCLFPFSKSFFLCSVHHLII